jgi:hypothetical protein
LKEREQPLRLLSFRFRNGFEGSRASFLMGAGSSGKNKARATALRWLECGMGREAGFSAPQLTMRL